MAMEDSLFLRFPRKIKVRSGPYRLFPHWIQPLKGRTHAAAAYDEDDNQDQERNLEPRVRVLKNVKRTNRLQLVVSPNESLVEFVGTTYLGEAATPQMCTYALGVVDKQTGTLKIVQFEANKAQNILFFALCSIRVTDGSIIN